MTEPSLRLVDTAAVKPSPGGEDDFEVLLETRSRGLVRRLFTTYRHFIGLLMGGLWAWVGSRPRPDREGFYFRVAWLNAWLLRPFMSRKYVNDPFPVQLRRRLEALGPTYIKLGQILSLREDLLPLEVTEELKLLLDRLPALPFPRYLELVGIELGCPVEEIFSWIEPQPIGSASIGQTHRATTLDGDEVILKLVKPGILGTLRRDVVLLKAFGHFLQMILGRYQPRRVIDEFCSYTLKEADLRIEADNAETFAANFSDMPEIVFPRIYREYSGRTLLVMEYLDGLKPSDPAISTLPIEDRDRIIDLGATAIIRMIYQDGFFHADLHPGNLIILSGPRDGFIDLGIVGRFDDDLRRTLLYYYYCLVIGDAENASRYLVSIAKKGRGGDPKGFRQDVEEICRRWQRSSSFEHFSIARLILESVGRAGSYRMYFPVEMVLMVKALVTFEAVGQMLKPGFDVARATKPAITRLFLAQFSPLRLAQEGLRGAPELVDALVKAPMLVTEGLRVLEQQTQRPPENPFSGIRGTVFAGFCVVAGAIVIAANGPWGLGVALFGVGTLLALRRGAD